MEKFGFYSICIYNNFDSFDIAARSIEKSNFLISSHLKDNTTRRSPSSTIPSEKELQQVFLLPHKVALEPYVRAFQYKVLNRILYTNEKLHKIGFTPHKDCTLCKSESETLTHLLYHCPFSIASWRDFEAYWLLVKNEQIHLTLGDIIAGIIKDHAPYLTTFYWLQNLTCGTVEETKLLRFLRALRTSHLHPFN